MSKTVSPEKFDTELVAGSVDKAVAEFEGSRSGGNYMFPPEAIRKLPGFNVRVKNAAYKARVAWIKNSIAQNGYDPAKPLKVVVAHENGEQVVYLQDGEHRLDAIMEGNADGTFKLLKVPCSIAPKTQTREEMSYSLGYANSGEKLSPYELGLVAKRLVTWGEDPKVIAQRWGYEKRYIDDLLFLVGGPKAIRDMVISGRVSSTLAISEMREHGADAIERLKNAETVAEAAGKSKVTAKHLKPAKPRKASSGKPKGKPAADEPITISRETALSWCEAAGVAHQSNPNMFLTLIATVLEAVHELGGNVRLEAEEAL